jgi:tetrapyrrole methylase family protein/MazG family protein
MSSDSPLHDKEARIRAVPQALERVLTLARVLRDPGGCPWDREQTVESLTPYLQEETFEVVEAVGSGNREAFREELGDLLFLVAFLALAGEDTGWGTVQDTANAVVDKLVRRHPHVFGTGPELESEGALRQWEEIKRGEKDEPEGTVPSALGRRPAGLPALTTAFRISEKAGAVGFEWPDVAGALDKLEEEVRELRREVDTGAPREDLENELGDVLYSLVNISRYLKVDPERSLRTTTAKFIRRFRYIEEELHRRGKTPETSNLQEMDALWDEAKGKGIG